MLSMLKQGRYLILKSIITFVTEGLIGVKGLQITVRDLVILWLTVNFLPLRIKGNKITIDFFFTTNG